MICNTVDTVKRVARSIGRRTAGLVEAFSTPTLTHLPDGAQQLPIAEHDHQEGHNEAEHKQADDVGDVIGCLGIPVD